jgi:hypothetical protein
MLEIEYVHLACLFGTDNFVYVAILLRMEN